MSFKRLSFYRMRWWREVVGVLVGYTAYSIVRNTLAASDIDRARQHAVKVMEAQAHLGINNEADIQRWLFDRLDQGADLFFRFWNIYYGSAHFVVTIAAMVILYRKAPHRFPLWRNTAFATTILALIGFSLYPLMPPRMFDGSGAPNMGFTDTINTIGGIWSFKSDAIAALSNQYAAMPSLHCAWALWVAFVLFPMCKQRVSKLAVICYPIATIFAVVVTANHFWFDAIGGATTLLAGFLVARILTRILYGHTIGPVQLQDNARQLLGSPDDTFEPETPGDEIIIDLRESVVRHAGDDVHGVTGTGLHVR